ncbi:hypothetical protein PF002_g23284 [Phytophthora fragariae]|uniref:Protein kinase domain-containing protein n=2 Tax=Phytophthora fragariae TaxID=53985 RepID=A0A6A3X3Y0_9STRA|nr:hypothetical protein PF002_g23284 [Phytophthora fragariae]
MAVFQRNIPTPSHMGPVLGRSSYIDDIAHGAVSWDQLWEDLNKLLFRLRYWNISVSLPKSEFGKRSILYLFHEISAGGIRAIKVLLPEKRRDMRQINIFLSEIKMMATVEHPHIVRFVGVAWDAPIDLSAVSELMPGGDLFSLLRRFDRVEHRAPGFDVDKAKIALHVAQALTYLHSLDPAPKIAKGVRDLPFPNTLKGVQSFLGSLNYYHKFIEDFPVVAAVLYELTDEQIRSKRDLSRAKESFEILKRKIVSTPLLRHPDRTKPFVIIPHANRWAACAVLGQEYDGVIHPVRFTGRVLNDAELRYHIAEKEVIAVLRVLQVFRTLIEGCPLEVYTRYSVLKWIIQSKTADGRCVPWGVALSHWNLDIRKVKKDEDDLAAIMGAGITPREYLDEVAESLVPAKGLVKAPPVISVEMLEDDFEGVVLSFDGAAKTSTRKGSCGCVLWKLPGWSVMEAQGFILEDVTVNDAEYNGLLKGLQMARERDITELVVVGDSRIVIQQVQGLINCHQPNLQRKLAECEAMKEHFTSLRLVHVKRDFNQAADYIT